MKNIEDLNIRHFKLINGDDILALVHKKENGKIFVERPVLVHSNLIGGFQLQPWFPFSSQTMFTITIADIMAHVNIDHDVKLTYMKAVTEKPVIPDLKTEEEMVDEYENYLDAEEALETSYGVKKVLH